MRAICDSSVICRELERLLIARDISPKKYHTSIALILMCHILMFIICWGIAKPYQNKKRYIRYSLYTVCVKSGMGCDIVEGDCLARFTAQM